MRPSILLIAAVLGGLLFSAVRPVWTLDPDAAAYVTLARGLASGDGYVLGGVPHAKYPPGLPLLLAGTMKLAGPDAYDVLHGLLVAILLVAVVLAWRLVLRLGYPPTAALAVATCVGLSQPFFQLSVEYLRTEVPFTALTLGALLAILAAVSPQGRLGHALLAGVLVAAAVFTRLAGVTLLAAPAFALLRPGSSGAARVRATLVIVLGLLAVGLWMERGRSLRTDDPNLPDYGSELLASEPRDLTKTVRADMPPLDGASFARRVRGNVVVLARASAVLLTNVDKAAARLPVGLLTLALLLAGLGAMVFARTPRPDEPARETQDAAQARRDVAARRLAAVYVLGSLALYLVWPFNQQERFYVPLLPVLLLAAGEGLLLVRAGLRRVADAPANLPRTLLLGGGLLVLGVLAAQRSDDPVVFGRWSKSYAAMLAAGTVGCVVLAGVLKARFVPEPRPGATWLVVALFAVPFGALRFVEWPAQVADFEARRAHDVGDPELAPVDDELARIDVHPVLERVARYLRAHAEPDALLMTDVPKMMAVLTHLRCVPFVYRVDPPAVETGTATWVFYTRFWPDASAALDEVSAGWTVAYEVPLGDDLSGGVARLFRVR